MSTFCFILYKIIHVPITHDELSASIYYPTLSWVEILKSDCWPSNHILNSLCIKISETVFGIEQWSVRLSNLLSFILLFFALTQLAKYFFDESLFLYLIPFFTVLGNPFLLDFFGLARGYGMSNAFLVCAVLSLLLYQKFLHNKWIFCTMICSILAAYANFTLLIFWVAIQLILGLLFIFNSIEKGFSAKEFFKVFGIVILIDVAFLGLSYEPLYKMSTTNQFQYWSKNGFYTDTIKAVVTDFNYDSFFSQDSVEVPFTIVFMLALSYSLFIILTDFKASFKNPLVLTTALLLAVTSVNLLQSKLLGTPYLTGRTALSYYVLFALVCMFLVRFISHHFFYLNKIFLPIVLIFFGVHLFFSANLKWVREWRYDENTLHVLKYLEDYKTVHPSLEKINLNTNWIFNPSFYFYAKTGKTPWLNLLPQNKQLDTVSNSLFYYAHEDEIAALKNYQTVLNFKDNNGSLLILKAAK